MTIISTLKSIFSILFPALLDSAEREFKKLPAPVQAALIQQGRLGQIIKLYYPEGLQAILEAARQELQLEPEVTNGLLHNLARKFNLETPQELIDYLQTNTAEARLEDSAWDSLWTLISGQLQVIASNGQINWATVALGITEFIYRKFIRGKLT